jgi:RHS repeat-associated protein
MGAGAVVPVAWHRLRRAGVVTATYTTENDSYYGSLLHIQRATGESRFPIYDEIGSASGLVDASGAVTDTYDMDTFGSPRGSSGSTPNPYRYGAAWGYITDPSGFLQLGARYYWPEVGRFVSQDPARIEDHAYVYASNDPLVHTDPSGLVCPDCYTRYSNCMDRADAWHAQCAKDYWGSGIAGDVIGCLAGCAVACSVTGHLATPACALGCFIGAGLWSLYTWYQYNENCGKPYVEWKAHCNGIQDSCPHG